MSLKKKSNQTKYGSKFINNVLDQYKKQRPRFKQRHLYPGLNPKDYQHMPTHETILLDVNNEPSVYIYVKDSSDKITLEKEIISEYNYKFKREIDILVDNNEVNSISEWENDKHGLHPELLLSVKKMKRNAVVSPERSLDELNFLVPNSKELLRSYQELSDLIQEDIINKDHNKPKNDFLQLGSNEKIKRILQGIEGRIAPYISRVKKEKDLKGSVWTVDHEKVCLGDLFTHLALMYSTLGDKKKTVQYLELVKQNYTENKLKNNCLLYTISPIKKCRNNEYIIDNIHYSDNAAIAKTLINIGMKREALKIKNTLKKFIEYKEFNDESRLISGPGGLHYSGDVALTADFFYSVGMIKEADQLIKGIEKHIGFDKHLNILSNDPEPKRWYEKESHKWPWDQRPSNSLALSIAYMNTKNYEKGLSLLKKLEVHVDIDEYPNNSVLFEGDFNFGWKPRPSVKDSALWAIAYKMRERSQPFRS